MKFRIIICIVCILKIYYVNYTAVNIIPYFLLLRVARSVLPDKIREIHFFSSRVQRKIITRVLLLRHGAPAMALLISLFKHGGGRRRKAWGPFNSIQ